VCPTPQSPCLVQWIQFERDESIECCGLTLTTQTPLARNVSLREHFDNKEGVTIIKRAATLIMYLHDVESGASNRTEDVSMVTRQVVAQQQLSCR